MARTKISEFSATAADNTDIDNIDIAEGCAPSGINNAIRELMAQLKDMQTGASGDTFTFTSLVATTADINGGTVDGVTIGGASAGAGSFTNLAYTGTLTGGTGVVNIGSGQVYKDASGNVGIGTSSPTVKLQVAGGSVTEVRVVSSGNLTTGAASLIRFGGSNSATSGYFGYGGSASTIDVWNSLSGALTFGTSNLERMRIDSSGSLLVGTTSVGGVGFTFARSATEPYWQLTTNTATNINNFYLFNQNATYNGYRFYVKLDGGVVNYSGNNVNLSDERTKTNIVLAGNYLAKICAIPVKLFNYKDEADGEQRTLGVIAQDVEAVAPEFVNNDGWEGSDPEDGVPLKTIYTTDLMFGLMKAIQEQQALITQLQADVAALKGAA